MLTRPQLALGMRTRRLLPWRDRTKLAIGDAPPEAQAALPKLFGSHVKAP